MGRSQLRVVGLIFSVLVILSLGSRYFAAALAQAADRWDVAVGGDADDGTISVNAFTPSTVTIHVGDTVAWSFAPGTPHSVTFLSGAPRLPLIAGPGPGAGELTLGPAFFNAPPGPPPDSATYNGTGVLSTGDPPEKPFTFSVTFTATGVFPYACMIHPGMNGSVEVLSAGAALVETPAQATARGQAQRSALLDQVRADAQTVQSAHGASPGLAATHSVAVGISSLAGPGNAGGASSLQFLPGTITVRRGDLVVFTVADPLEIHTVTFTSGAAPPDFVDVREGPAGPEGPPLLVLTANVANPTGGSVYRGTGYLNSGILSPGNALVLAVDAPPGTYDYLCLIHGTPTAGMRGKLIVTDEPTP